MKKQEYIDLGLHFGLPIDQIERTLCDIFGITKTELFSLKDLASTQIYRVQLAFHALANGNPEAYVLEKEEFYGKTFEVGTDVLIPRNDTEILVRECLEFLLKRGDIRNMNYVDVGTGTGCIAVSIVTELQPLKFHKSYALDISPEALDIAQKNIETHSKDMIELQKSNLLEAIFYEEAFIGKDLCITANLPYIKDGDYENMSPNVVDHEPDLALYGGPETGFELYEDLIKQIFQLKQVAKLGEVHLFIEIGFDQKEYSEKYLSELGLSFEYFLDDSNIARVVHIFGF